MTRRDRNSPRGDRMARISDIALETLRRTLGQQPKSDGKLKLAWTAAVGVNAGWTGTPTLAPDGTLTVKTTSGGWQNEIKREEPRILSRLNHVLGREHVERIKTAN